MTSQMVDIHTPGLKWWLSQLESNFDANHSVDLYINALKRRNIRNSTPAALGTAQLLLRLIAARRFSTIQSLVDYILSLESRLAAARPREMSIRNMVRRVIGIVREEAENNGMGDLFKAAIESDQQGTIRPQTRPPLLSSHTSFAPTASVTNLFNLISHPSTPGDSVASSPVNSGHQTPLPQRDVRPSIIQDIQELIDEIESCESSIAEYALQVIHKNEIILTYGLPIPVHRLLLKAAQKRDFTVVVVEGSPNMNKRTHGAAMNKVPLSELDVEEEADTAAARKSLQDRSIEVIVISDTDLYNFIGRVNKVIIGTDYVLADGALLAPAGTLNVVRAANNLQKPVAVVTGTHTLCPVTSFYREMLIEMGAPVTVGYDEGYLLENAQFPNPTIDFIEPEYVSMFVTNNGIMSPTNINRATLDLYHMPEADLV